MLFSFNICMNADLSTVEVFKNRHIEPLKLHCADKDNLAPASLNHLFYSSVVPYEFYGTNHVEIK